ncbi:MAG: 16S rRNA (uracil(1498)-N(3))-methyltransferase, partial [Agathobacter sp.]|nr:16S rRNA (uracil(1498)-N(3))-methyltransferase [Agathobacter sp.]
KKAKAKITRWQAIAESAAKQSKRTVIPEVTMPLTWKQATKMAEELDVVLVPYENARGMEVIEINHQGEWVNITARKN